MGVRLLSIGEFSAACRLSPKALRLYDRLGFLRPARVDAMTGYRWYAPTQIVRARTVGLLRRPTPKSWARFSVPCSEP